MAYPDYSKVFEIYTDASSKQLGAVITQENRPMAFFSRKLSAAQPKYSVTKIELLAIIKILKEFKGMLWGQSIKVYTNHANLIRDALCMTSDRVYRWRLLLEEYGPKIVYIKDIHNTIADTISRLEYDPSINQTAENYHLMKVKRRSSQRSQRQSWKTVSKHWCIEIDTDKREDFKFLFANYGEEDEIYPLTTIEISEAQCKDQELKVYYKKNARMSKKDMCLQLIEDTIVLCKNGKLIILASLQHRAVAWYHHYPQHPGHSCLKETMRSVIYWKGMRTNIRRYVKPCRSCQVNKRHSLRYGGKGIKATCLDCTKDAEIFDKTSAQVSNLVYKCWFSRYPRCCYMIYNNGSEFILHFHALCKTYGVKHKLASIKNPQANAILEGIHAVFTIMLCTDELNMAELVNASDINIFLADAAWAICSTHNTVLKASPGTAIFGQDMLFDIPLTGRYLKNIGKG